MGNDGHFHWTQQEGAWLEAESSHEEEGNEEDEKMGQESAVEEMVKERIAAFREGAKVSREKQGHKRTPKITRGQQRVTCILMLTAL